MNILQNVCRFLNITSSFINKLKVDIVSDLHIDHWSLEYMKKYPFGTQKNSKFYFNISNVSPLLIVAGDICDNLNDSIDFLHYASHFYETILFVDGNHEHTEKYPDLYKTSDISEMINNKKVVYLPKNSYVVNKTAFIGSCGWWNYNNSDSETISKCTNYFRNWIPHFGKTENLNFIQNVINRSNEEYTYLDKLLTQYEHDPNIDNIVIVTHTVPQPSLCSNFTFSCKSVATQYNSNFQSFEKYKKISHWIYGHSHTNNDILEKNIRYINNARGRPDDYDRVSYQVKTIEI